jgi:hypothetical protein
MILQGRNLTQGLAGADVDALHGELASLGYAIPPTEAWAKQFGTGTLSAVEQAQAAAGVSATGVVDAASGAAIATLIVRSTFVVTGHVTSPVSAAVSGLLVRLVDKNVGGDVVAATGTTRAGGAYSLSTLIGPPTLLARLKPAPDLQTQVFTTSANGAVTIVASSAVGVAAKSPLTLDIALPASATGLKSEYETLSAALSSIYSGRFKDLKESDATQDVTYLSARTGWDARAIAMASLADQFSTLTAAPVAPPGSTAPPAAPSSLRPELYYALFRAGAPAAPATLFQMPSTTATAIWTQAVAENVIPASLAGSIPQATQTFQALSAANLLTLMPTIGVSKFSDVIAPTLTGAGQAQQFAAMLVANAGNWNGLWSAVGTTFGAATQAKLQLLGQLSYLTLDNAPLLAALNAAEAQAPLAHPIDLAARGYFDPAKWVPLIGASIPVGVPGANAQAQAANYAAWLAAQVRLSFPTATLAAKVKSGAIPLGASASAAEATTFLVAHQAYFAFGVETVDQYLTRNRLTPSKAAVYHLKRLQRVHQMTTSDDAMSALLSAGLDSAYAIVRYDEAGFVRAFSGQAGGADAARAIHARARQIHGAALNVALAYAGQRVSSGFGAASQHMWPLPIGGAGASGSTAAAATLDTLFGSLDTCGCDDCESILSPAAYLVDLLHYLDQPATVSGANPQTILFGRRPDLQYLPLSCANTGTALPYIDLVNETLEYFVANGARIDGFQGFDTGDQITSAELVAAPQNVDDAAYAKLQTSFYPPPLPFNRPLALLRAQMAALGVSTPDTMETLRKNDSLNGATPSSADYGWSDILIERLGISRDEMRIFTDATLQVSDLMGASLVNLQTTSVHDLVRLAGIDYDDLVALLQTEFLNPGAALILKLQKLGAPFATLAALKANPTSVGPLFIAALPADLDYSQYGPNAATGQDIVNWVLSDAVYPVAMNLVTISNPSGGSIDCTGTALRLRYADGNTLSGTDWLKFARFLRLWRKIQALTGADNPTSVAQTDAILAALYPVSQIPATPWDPNQDNNNRPLLDQGFATAILRAGFILQAAGLLGLDPGASLPSLLACVAPIGVTGSPSFYQSLFASPAMIAIDPGVATLTLKGALFAGDTLRTTINGANVDHSVAAGETIALAATGIAAAINASTTIDPASGQPIGKRFLAVAAAPSIAVTAGFVVITPPPAPGQTETLTLASAGPTSWTLTIGGAATPGDVVQFSIDGATIAYTVATGDALTSVADGLAAAINATTAADPYCGQALNTIVAASSANGVVTLIAAGAGASFSLAGSVLSTFKGAYGPDSSNSKKVLTISGAFGPGAILTTSINGVSLTYSPASGATVTTIAQAIVAEINNSTIVDPVTGLAIKALVSAASLLSDTPNLATIALAAVDPTVGFQVAASATETTFAAGRAASPFADNGYGVLFADAKQKLLVHEPLLSAACNLTGAEFSFIVEALGFDMTTPLDLANVSAVYRNGWLAHALQISVRDFLRFKQCCGIDPFGPPDLGAAPDAAAPLIRFIRLVQAMSTAGLDPVQALYLIWNEDDSGALAPQAADVESLALTLRKDFAAVEATFARKDDPDGSIAQGLMALVYGAADAAFFFGLLAETYQATVPFANAAPTLSPAALAASGGRLIYDDQNKLLSARGYLDPPTQAAIKAALAVATVDASDNANPGVVALTPATMTNIAPGLSLLIDAGAKAELVVVQSTTATTFTVNLALAHSGAPTPFPIVNDPSVPAAVDALALANQQAVAPYFAKYPELLPLYTAFVASSEPTSQRYTDLLANFLPTLKAERKQQQALVDVSAACGQDLSFAAALLQDPDVLHADGAPAAPAVADLTGTEEGGLCAQVFLDGNPTGANPQTVDILAPIQFAQVALLSGAVGGGATVTTTIDGIDVPYALAAGDVDLSTLAGNVAKAINASTAVDPKNGAAIGAVISAAAAGPSVVLTSRSPADPTRVFTLACRSSAASLVYAPTQGPLASSIAAQLPAGVSGALPAPSGAAGLAITLQGFIVAPQDGAYNFAAVADAGANVSVNIGGATTPLLFGGAAPPNPPVKLSAGALTSIRLAATGVKTTLTLCWMSAAAGVGWQPVPAANLFTQGQISRLGDTYARFLKATSLATALALDADEIAYLDYNPALAVATASNSKFAAGSVAVTPASLAHIVPGVRLAVDAGVAAEIVEVTATTATSFTATFAKAHDGSATPFAIVSAPSPDAGRGWLNTLPGLPFQDPLGPTYKGGGDGARLRATLKAALDFARLKNALSPSDERLLETLKAPGTLLPNGRTALADLTGWGPDSLNALLIRFNGSTAIAPLSRIENFARTFDALAIVSTARVSAGALLGALTNAPSAAGVAALQSALRAHYAVADWLNVVKPINDPLRIASRDALVAYSLQAFKANPAKNAIEVVDTADKLFEYFLIDVETQPPVMTSRIRLALSTVQLFIERVLRGIETQTSPGDIDAQQWSWMKRYRVWQANREVFLWPENWLYPELRDDQTPLYKTTSSALLQGDVTDDAATSAYLGYLASLEQIAKLEPCGIWYVPASDGSSGGGASDEVAYVVARTAGAHRKHYFRQLQGGSWTPWEEVKIDCEDMPLTPIVWNGRLFLFWLRIVKSQPAATAGAPAMGQMNASDPVAKWTLDKNSNSDGNVTDYAKSASNDAANVTIGAVLCWSEYLNGKWTDMKTSDVNRPAVLPYDSKASDRRFELDRNRIRIVVAPYKEYVPSDALVLAILPPGQTAGPDIPYGPGFVLHNTHSQPINSDDIIGDWSGLFGAIAALPLPLRALRPSVQYLGDQTAGTFSLSRYISFDSLNSGPDQMLAVLGFPGSPRFVQPQIGPGDGSNWPFFYEDKRNQFYVSIQPTFTPYQFYNGFGSVALAGFNMPATANIPILTTGPFELGPVAGNSAVWNLAVSSGAAAPWLAAGGARPVVATLNSTGTFAFQGRIIGPSGGIADPTVNIARS